ncbi:hypothetical protein QL285_003995 [Trifolium repens]|nr:hypothetical protein QL285_003995 [Trifolium repens]
MFFILHRILLRPPSPPPYYSISSVSSIVLFFFVHLLHLFIVVHLLLLTLHCSLSSIGFVFVAIVEDQIIGCGLRRSMVRCPFKVKIWMARILMGTTVIFLHKRMAPDCKYIKETEELTIDKFEVQIRQCRRAWMCLQHGEGEHVNAKVILPVTTQELNRNV